MEKEMARLVLHNSARDALSSEYFSSKILYYENLGYFCNY